MTKATKEIIQTSAFIVAVAIIILIFWVYPLNQAGKINAPVPTPDSAPTPAEYDLAGDTVSFTTEDNLEITGWVFTADMDTAAGTAILLHGLMAGSWSQWEKAAMLHGHGFTVYVFDQRAYGASEGEHPSPGYYEASDLQSIITRMYLEDKITHPFIVWGEDHGGSAAIRLWPDEPRIDYVIAEQPLVNGRHWQNVMIDRKDMSCPGVMRGLVWWWMKQNSGHELSIEETDISDQFAMATEEYTGRLHIIACGSDRRPSDAFLAEMIGLGGVWHLLDCGTDRSVDNIASMATIQDLLPTITADTADTPE